MSASKQGVVSFAESGFKDGGDNYDKYRPGYTPETVAYVAKEIVAVTKRAQKDPEFNVVELGAGTGKLTELLVSALPSGSKYLAVEPSENFSEVLKEKHLKGLQIHVGSASNIPAGDHSVENLVCAASFHWFSDNKHLKEMHRALVKGGNLFIVSNIRDYSKDWMQDFLKQRVQVLRRIGDSLKHAAHSMEWRKDIQSSPLFEEVTELSLPGFQWTGTVEDIISQSKTQSFYKNLPEKELEEYMDELRDILRNWPGLDLNNIVYPFVSKVFVYRAV